MIKLQGEKWVPASSSYSSLYPLPFLAPHPPLLQITVCTSTLAQSACVGATWSENRKQTFREIIKIIQRYALWVSLWHKWRCHSSNSPWTWHECIAPKGVKESQRNLLMFWQPTRLCCWGYKPTSQFMFLSAKQNIAPKYPTPLCYSSKTKQHQRRIGCHGNTYPCRENIDVHQDMLFKKHWTKDIDANGPVALPQ